MSETDRLQEIYVLGTAILPKRPDGALIRRGLARHSKDHSISLTRKGHELIQRLWLRSAPA